MGSRITRRDWLKLIGGSAVGLMFTPVPWRLLDDSAKWTQNWPWTPVPRKGRIEHKYTTCTLCPQGCGVKVKCVGGRPVSLAGIPGHPLNDGALCTIGLGAHLLAFHPSRLHAPYSRIRNGKVRTFMPGDRDEIIAKISKAIRAARIDGGSVGILDFRPNRSISYVYRRFLSSLPEGYYIVPNPTDGITAAAVNRVTGQKHTSYGVDTTKSRTLVSFRTPVLDGWGTLSQSADLVRRMRESAENRLNVIQIESVRSRTAQLATEWIPVRPGTEAAFAIGLMRVMIDEGLCDTRRPGRSLDAFKELLGKFPPNDLEDRTGIPAEKMTEIARRISKCVPAVAVFGGDPVGGPFGKEEETIFMDLNILLGADRGPGGIVPRREIPSPFGDAIPLASETRISELRDHSISVLIMDGSESGDVLPWSLIRKKLAGPASTVVSLSPYLAGVALESDYLLPSPASMDSYNDLPTPAGFSGASYSISLPIVNPPAGAIQPSDFIRKLTDELETGKKNLHRGDMIDLGRNRANKIFAARQGEVFDPASGRMMPVLSIRSESEFFGRLSAGGCWTDERQTPLKPAGYDLLGGAGAGEIISAVGKTRRKGMPGSTTNVVLLPHGQRGAGSACQGHPLIGKVYRESELREEPQVALINPGTASAHDLMDGRGALLKTEEGEIDVKVKTDASLMTGIVQLAPGPQTVRIKRAPEKIEVEAPTGSEVLAICRIDGDSTWKTTFAEITPS